MELISWSLDAIDTIFSTRKQGSVEARCPDGTSAAGYTVDVWGTWRTFLCLMPLSVEDVEDLFIFGFLIAGFIIIGFTGALVYREIKKVGSAVNSPKKLPNLIEGMNKAVGLEIGTLHRGMDAIMDRMTALQTRMENSLTRD